MKKYMICKKKDWSFVETVKINEKERPFNAEIPALSFSLVRIRHRSDILISK